MQERLPREAIHRGFTVFAEIHPSDPIAAATEALATGYSGLAPVGDFAPEAERAQFACAPEMLIGVLWS
jgi:parvulin-like peptidyl-prolyl isomerase